MKFEKWFQAEMVPEWKIKYIDYKSLKKRLRELQNHNNQNNHDDYNSNHASESTNDSQSHLEIFSVQSAQPTQSRASSMTSASESIQDFFHIVSSALQRHHSLPTSPPAQITSLDTLMGDVTPKERFFFVALDKELEKIEEFYKIKEDEALTRMNLLIKQYEMLKKKMKNEKTRSEKISAKDLVKQSIDFLTSNTPGTASTTSPENQEKYSPYLPNEQQKYYKTAKQHIKKAVFEFYRGVELLRKYRVLNYNGFTKLLKKYDKISGRNGTQVYIQKVKNCYFVKSAIIKRLLEDAENFYVNNFENGSHPKAIRKLRTPNKKHKVYCSSSLRVGLCLGLALPAIVYVLKLINHTELTETWKILIELYIGLYIPVVLLLLIGVNMFVWTRSRINYKFILEFDPRDNLDFRQYLELPAVIFLIMTYIMVFNFLDVINYIDQFTYPVYLIIFISTILFNPFPVFYYNARRWFIISMARLFGSGFLHVEFRDYFISEVLTSLSYSLVMLRLFSCHHEDCGLGISPWTPSLGSIPALFRLLQCYRRYIDTKKSKHIINFGKFVLAIASMWATFGYRTVLFREDDHNKIAVSVFWWLTQTISSIYSISWDMKADWSLLNLHSINYLLRDELYYEHHWLYYFAIISNFFLKFSWVSISVSPKNPAISLSIAFSEMIRRWQWIFFRIENEHVTNCREFCAIKEIPLPFKIEELGDDIPLSPTWPWSRKNFADNWKDFEPRKNTSGYVYSEESDNYDEYYYDAEEGPD